MKQQRNEMKPSNPYYLPKHRLLEMRHFCLQYDDWRKELRSITYVPEHTEHDPTANTAILREKLTNYINLIESVAKETDSQLWTYILYGATHETTYESLSMLHNMPVGRSKYYDLKHRFYWILAQNR